MSEHTQDEATRIAFDQDRELVYRAVETIIDEEHDDFSDAQVQRLRHVMARVELGDVTLLETPVGSMPGATRQTAGSDFETWFDREVTPRAFGIDVEHGPLNETLRVMKVARAAWNAARSDAHSYIPNSMKEANEAVERGDVTILGGGADEREALDDEGFVATIMRDACELDPCDPEAADAILILWEDLRFIIARALARLRVAGWDAEARQLEAAVIVIETKPSTAIPSALRKIRKVATALRASGNEPEKPRA